MDYNIDKCIYRHIEELVGRYPVLEQCLDDIIAAYQIMEECYVNDGKLLIAGNGGQRRIRNIWQEN